jgi:hypothetical protein
MMRCSRATLPGWNVSQGEAPSYELGCKPSITTPATKTNGDQFVMQAKARHGNRYDGRILDPIIGELESLPQTAQQRWQVLHDTFALAAAAGCLSREHVYVTGAEAQRC